MKGSIQTILDTFWLFLDMLPHVWHFPSRMWQRTFWLGFSNTSEMTSHLLTLLKWNNFFYPIFFQLFNQFFNQMTCRFRFKYFTFKCHSKKTLNIFHFFSTSEKEMTSRFFCLKLFFHIFLKVQSLRCKIQKPNHFHSFLSSQTKQVKLQLLCGQLMKF